MYLMLWNNSAFSLLNIKTCFLRLMNRFASQQFFTSLLFDTFSPRIVVSSMSFEYLAYWCFLIHRDIALVRFLSSFRQTETVFSAWVSPIISELALIQIMPCCRTRQTKSLLWRTLYVEGSSMQSSFAKLTAA